MVTPVGRSTPTPTPTAQPTEADEGKTQTVQRGDTMSAIARQNQIELQQLVEANPQIADPNKIKAGQRLNIPQAPNTATAAADGSAAGTPPTSNTADSATVRSSRQRAVNADAAARARVNAQATPQAEAKPLFSSGTIRSGAEGVAVTDLQQQLNARGANLGVDGDFGPKTEQAVRNFQRQQGIGVDGVVGPETRQAFRDTATNPVSTGPVNADGTVPSAEMALREGAEGPQVEALQTRLNNAAGAGLRVDGDFGARTRDAVHSFQQRAGLDPDGVAGPDTMRALDEVEAGTRQLTDPPPVSQPDVGPQRPEGPRSQSVTVGDNTFNVHNMTRREFGRRSVPGNRIISMDSNSVSGRSGEILRPLVIIPNNATPAERAAAQQSVDRVAQWLNQNIPGGGRATTGRVRTTAENGRGLNGFYHTEFHSVNDTAAVRLIRERPQEYAQILGETLGQVPGANFIVPHGNINSRGIEDPGAVGNDGTSEIGLGRFVIEEGFKRL